VKARLGAFATPVRPPALRVAFARSARSRARLRVDPRVPLQVVRVWRMHRATKLVDRPVERFDVFRSQGIATSEQLQGASNDVRRDRGRHAPGATRRVGGDQRRTIGRDMTRSVGHERERPGEAEPRQERAPAAHARSFEPLPGRSRAEPSAVTFPSRCPRIVKSSFTRPALSRWQEVTRRGAQKSNSSASPGFVRRNGRADAGHWCVLRYAARRARRLTA
jgi:hypothetical protein